MLTPSKLISTVLPAQVFVSSIVLITGLIADGPSIMIDEEIPIHPSSSSTCRKYIPGSVTVRIWFTSPLFQRYSEKPAGPSISNVSPSHRVRLFASYVKSTATVSQSCSRIFKVWLTSKSFRTV